MKIAFEIIVILVWSCCLTIWAQNAYRAFKDKEPLMFIVAVAFVVMSAVFGIGDIARLVTMLGIEP